jgi:hypothetical protein
VAPCVDPRPPGTQAYASLKHGWLAPLVKRLIQRDVSTRRVPTEPSRLLCSVWRRPGPIDGCLQIQALLRSMAAMLEATFGTLYSVRERRFPVQSA